MCCRCSDSGELVSCAAEVQVRPRAATFRRDHKTETVRLGYHATAAAITVGGDVWWPTWVPTAARVPVCAVREPESGCGDAKMLKLGREPLLSCPLYPGP